MHKLVFSSSRRNSTSLLLWGSLATAVHGIHFRVLSSNMAGVSMPSYTFPFACPPENALQDLFSIYALFQFIFCRSGLALGSGLFPICQKGAKELFGVGCGLIHSILETPKAPSHPHPFRVGVPGISTFPKQNAQTTPLFSKGDIVER